MRIVSGSLYHIKDDFFDLINDKELMINHENGHSRPSYLAIEDGKILWFVPLSTQISKYEKIINQKMHKYGRCQTIIIEKINGKKQAILIQNAFPTISKYISSQHKVGNKILKVPITVQKTILKNFSDVMSIHNRGINIFFPNIDRIKNIMLEELKKDSEN